MAALGADERALQRLGVVVVPAVPAAARVREDPGGPGVGERLVGVVQTLVPYGLEEAVGAGVVGADLPLHTTGRRRGAAGPAPTVVTTGIRAVSAVPLRCRAIRGDWTRRAEPPSWTRKLAWLTMTCAGSLGTFTMLSAGASSSPDERSPWECGVVFWCPHSSNRVTRR